ncbi:MAG: ATP-dependent DNA helicase RecG [Candidatus Solibacter sp.]|nr:ATP-dependent DNA helicase RecG [Candidatus Solibacter sp.]
MDLSTPVTYLKGVGPQRAVHLEAKGLRTAADLLSYAPFRYEDRSNVKPISELAPGEMATVLAVVGSVHLPRFRRRNVGLFEAFFTDDSGARLMGKWFNAAYLKNVLEPGVRVALYGKVEFDTYSRELAMMHPEHEILRADDGDGDDSLHTGRIVPVYEAAGKVSTRAIRTILRRLVDRIDSIEDAMPSHILKRMKLPGIAGALRDLHFPAPGTDLRLLNAFRTPAQFRMIFEEFFWLETGMALKRRQAQIEIGIAFQLTDRVRQQILKMLPFKPTAAQKKVLKEIALDMASASPMSRLLQGDVGSGKTIVAAQAAVIAVENGYQAALLAPTEILAAQHHANLSRVLAPLNYTIAPLYGSMSKKEKEVAKRALSSGVAKVAVGTHALLEEGVEFRRLGLAIIDEQHRFGVMQRKALQQKGVTPDVLVMTATPIPRTLALTIYGDLAVSVIDELPPGRKPIQTFHKTKLELELVYSFVLKQVKEGRQAYFVYPVIEESEALAVKAAQIAYEELSKHVFPQLNVALLHGRMKPADKDAVMDGFKRGEVQVLVSTTVIEVGVDVPNATVMVIENAERFGLAQIHQLRGRVGRGAGQSYCVLVTDKLSETGRERIRTLVDSTDGFHISEMDLRLRGPGEFLGTKQSGLPSFRIGNILRDQEILELARSEAAGFVDSPPSAADLDEAIRYIRENWQRRYGLALVG